MKNLIRFITNEPAMVVAVIVAILNIFGFSATDAAQVELRELIDALVILAGGGIVRQSVTPVAKLKASS